MAARADVVVRQKVEYRTGAYWMTEDRTLRFKGAKVRQDTVFSARGTTNNGVVASVPWGTNASTVSAIKDLASGDTITLGDHGGQLLAVKTSGAILRQKAAEIMARLAGRPKPPPPTPSGVTAKIGDYPTEEYDWTDAGGARMKLWVAKTFPRYQQIVACLERLFGLPEPDPTKGWIRLDLTTLPGLVLRAETTVYGTNVATTTLLSASEEPVEAAALEIPKGYRLVEPPPPGGPAAGGEWPLKVGAAFPDFNVQAVDGQPLSLAALRGKVVLIEFWATWALPCQAEVPNVVAAYQQHHGQGFEIIGVSLDEDRQKLLSYTQEHKMTWPEFFDGGGWKNELVLKYGIKSIPSTYLIDTNGVIIGENLRGKVLKQAVAAAMR